MVFFPLGSGEIFVCWVEKARQPNTPQIRQTEGADFAVKVAVLKFDLQMAICTTTEMRQA